MCKNLANMRLLENTKTKEQKTKEENQILHHTFVSSPSSRTLVIRKYVGKIFRYVF